VVRTLGLIRQTVAVTPLLSLLADAQQDDAVLAEVFIALRRLGDTEAYSKLEDYVNAKAGYAEIPLAKRLHVLNALLQQPEDAGVLDYGRLANLAKYLFEQSIKNNTVEQNKLVWLQILAHAKSVQSINWLEKQTHDSDAALRLAAYKTLLQISPDQNISLLKVAWQDKDLSIVNWALPGMLKAKIPLLTADYRKILADETMANTLWLFWDEFGFSGSAFDFISAVLPQAKSIAKSTVKAGSSGTAAEMVQTATGGLEGICYHQSAEINRFCALLAIQNKQLAARQLLVSLLQDKKMAASLRLSLLDRYQESFDPNAINVLYLLAQDKKDPLYQSVMLKLLGANNQSLLGFAEKTAQNVNEDNQIRFAAIEYLLRNGQPQAEQLFFH
jgi:hypothetical protein